MAVTLDNQKPIKVDGDYSVKLFQSIDMGDKGSDTALTTSGLTTAPTGSTSKKNDAAVNFSTIDTRNTAGKKDVSIGGVNLDNARYVAHSKSIDQIEREINDLLSIIGSNTGDTRGINSNDLLSGGALNVAKTELGQLQRSLEEQKTSTRDSRIGKNSGNIGTQGVGDKILGSHVIGGIDKVNALADKVLRSNTINNVCGLSLPATWIS